MGLLRLSERVRAFAHLILSSQASARLRIIGNMASALTAYKAFLNNFENVVIYHRVDIREDIKHYQDILSHASNKVDYSMGLSVYMLPYNMNLKIRSGTAGYNNKILVSDNRFSLGRNDIVNNSAPSHKTPIILKHAHKHPSFQSTPMHKEFLSKHTSAIMHEEEKIALVINLTWCLQNMVRFSLMKARDKVTLSERFKTSFSSEAHDKGDPWSGAFGRLRASSQKS